MGGHWKGTLTGVLARIWTELADYEEIKDSQLVNKPASAASSWVAALARLGLAVTHLHRNSDTSTRHPPSNPTEAEVGVVASHRTRPAVPGFEGL
jgi:hypothetical protein